MNTPLPLRTNGLCASLGRPEDGLRDISLELQSGERVGLIGPNGAGKTTLLLAVAGLIPFRGEVWIRGGELTPQSAPLLRKNLGFVFQNPDDQLFMTTVREEVAYGLRELGCSEAEILSRSREALQTLGIEDLAERSPQQLSYGEKRVVTLATALARGAGLHLLDEPSRELDPGGRRDLIRLLRKMQGSILLASHDLELIVETCSQVILLDGGRLITTGPTRKILNDEPLMLAHRLERPHILRHSHPHPSEPAP